DFTLTIQDSDTGWPTQPVFSAALPSLSFTAGVATIPGIKVFKAKDKPRFTATMTTVVPHIVVPSAQSPAIVVAPGITNSLKVITLDAAGDQTLVPRDG